MAYDKAPENPIVYTHKEFGAAYFDRSLPNAYERMFMICRAINFDFDNYNKNYSSPDVASKRRYVRNFFRFADHPVRYIFWKILPYLKSGKLRFLPVYWFTIYMSGFWYAGESLAFSSRGNARENVYSGHALMEHGKETFNYERTSSLFFHHSEGNATKGLTSNISVPPSPMFCRINNYVRDQNLRKYFAHRERRGADLFTGQPLNK